MDITKTQDKNKGGKGGKNTRRWIGNEHQSVKQIKETKSTYLDCKITDLFGPMESNAKLTTTNMAWMGQTDAETETAFLHSQLQHGFVLAFCGHS